MERGNDFAKGPMKRLAFIAMLAIGLAIPASAGAAGVTPANPGAAEVTALPIVQRDLKLAAAFWKAEEPALVAPCAPGQVFVSPMQNGVGDNGTIVLAGNVWAETMLGSCAINIAPVAWALGSSGDSSTSLMLCILIAHEYGHTLGLPDTEAVPMMSSDWSRRDDPLCDQSVYGWRWALPRDREWLAANHLAHAPDRRAQGMLRR